MSKQDRQGVRTAADLERKYSFGRTFADVYGLVADAQKAIEEVNKEFESLDSEGIFNRLTNYGEIQGIYRENDQIYINASYIKTGTISVGLIPNEVARTSQIPTDVSQLGNNAGYLTETGVTSIVDGMITTDYIKALGLTVDCVKLGGNMDLYETLDSDKVIGRLGYSTVTVDGKSQVALGFVTEKYCSYFASVGAMYLATEAGVLMQANDNIDLYCDYLKLNGTAVSVLISDERKKKDIDYDVNDKLVALFDALKPVSFKMLDEKCDNGQQHIGFIAQDVMSGVESAGLGDALVVADYKGFYTPNYCEMIAALVAKIQQLDAEIKEMKANG